MNVTTSALVPHLQLTTSDFYAAALREQQASAHNQAADPVLYFNCYSGFLTSALPLNISSCSLGYYCPNISLANPFTWPQICPPTIDCQITRLKSQYCDPQGPYEPQLCLPGHYCPNASLMFPCPSGSYCLRGSWEPRTCPFMSLCPPGTQMRVFYGGVVLCVVLDLLMVAAFLYTRFVSEPRASAVRLAAMRKRYGHDDAGAGAGGALEMLPIALESGYAAMEDGAPAPPPPVTNAKAVLRDGFKRCNSGVSLDLQFDSLGLTLPAPLSKTILWGVSGRIQPGRVTAVMGPSGAGKTTFLSVLTGKVNRTRGRLLINGVEGEMHAYRKAVGFVPQDDVMIRELTVRENVLFSARMRLPATADWPDTVISDYVDAVIEALGLTECANTRIGDVSSRGVSGGQRKRCNIAIELAAFPSALFLDEPTSGLDASAALEVCSTLRSIADLGLTVVAVIHQPRLEIFDSFDDLLLLAPGGRTAYVGPRSGVLPYFTTTLGFTFSVGNNPADQLLDFVAGAGLPTLPPSQSPTGGSDAGSGASGAGGAAAADFAAFPVAPVVRPPPRGEGAWGQPSSARGAAGAGSGGGLQLVNDLSEKMVVVGRSASEGGPDDGAEDAAAEVLGLRVGNSVGGGATRAGAYFDAAWKRYGAAVVVAAERAEAAQHARAVAEGRAAPPPFSPLNATKRGGGGSGILRGGSSRVGFSAGDEGGSEAGGGATPVLEDGAAALTNDRGAPFLVQVRRCFERSLLQQYRAALTYGMEVGVAAVSGGIMGLAASILPELYNGVLQPPYTLISPAPLEPIVPSVGMYIALAVGLAGSPAGVLAFGEEKDVFYREAAAGHNRVAYYVAKLVAVVPRFTLGSLHFAAVFHFMASPATSFSELYVLSWMQFFCVYGLSSIVSMLVTRDQAPLLAVIVSLVAGCMCGFGPSLAQAQEHHFDWLLSTSFARWAAEGFFFAETQSYRAVFMVDQISAPLFGYSLDRFGLDLWMCVLIGCLYRVVAGVLLLVVNRDKQR